MSSDVCSIRSVFLNYLKDFPLQIQDKRYWTSIKSGQQRDFYVDILPPSYHNYGVFGVFSYEKEDIFEVVGLGARHDLPAFWMWWKREGSQDN